MFLQIDHNDGSPIYKQIIEQIKHAISVGVFKVNEPIPTIREMAVQLKVNPNTVAKAVRELERDGFVKTFVGKGSFVTETAMQKVEEKQTDKALQLTKNFVTKMDQLGFNQKETLQFIKAYWKENL